MNETRRWFGKNGVMLLGILVIVYMYIPNIIVALMSFNDNSENRRLYSFQAFTLDNWLHPCAPDGMCQSVVVSIKIAIVATVVATLLGTLAAFGLVRHRFTGRGPMNTILFLPMATPEIVMGSSLLTLFLNYSVPLGFATILIAHIMFNISFVVVTVKARLANFPRHLEEAAMDLGANEWTTFWKVTFPLYIYGSQLRGIPVQVNVIGTIIFVSAVLLVLLTTFWQRRVAARDYGAGV